MLMQDRTQNTECKTENGKLKSRQQNMENSKWTTEKRKEKRGKKK
jgi:hypothetical protein